MTKNIYKKIVLIILILTSLYSFINANTEIISKNKIINNTNSSFIINPVNTNKISNSNFVEGELIIKYKDKNKLENINKNNISNTIGNVTFKIDHKIFDNVGLFKYNSNLNIDEVIQTLSQDDNIEYVHPNYKYQKLIETPNDPYFSNLWGLENNGQNIAETNGTPGSDVDWKNAMTIYNGNENISLTGKIIAIIDDGLYYNHPDLINNLWNGENCLDYNGTYLGGCIYGYNFASNNKNPLPSDSADNHGTHIAGTIGATINNSIGITGIHPNSKIMGLKTAYTTSQIIKAISFAKHNGANIINASWGCYGSDQGGSHAVCGGNYLFNDQSMIDSIDDFGGLFVASAGNGTGDPDPNGDDHDFGKTLHMYPCDLTLDNIICVAATDNNDQLASFSDYGSISVDIGAPGKGIYSTILDYNYLLIEDFDGVNPPELPSDWIQNFTGTWGTYGNGSNVLYGDLDYPYLGNNHSILTSIDYDLTSYNDASFSFIIGCDTEYDADDYTDYIQLDFDYGSGFQEIQKFDEYFLDYALGNPLDGIGSTAAQIKYNLTNTQNTENFRFRFHWITNENNNNHDGCRLDEIEIAGNDYTYTFYNGTSMAAPHVAGAAGVLWNYMPNKTTNEIKQILMETGDSLPALNGKTVSGNRLNLYNSLAFVAKPQILSFNSYTDISKNTTIGNGQYINQINPYYEREISQDTGIIENYNYEVYFTGTELAFTGQVNLDNFILLYTGSTILSGFSADNLSGAGSYLVGIQGENDAGGVGDFYYHNFIIDGTPPSNVEITQPINTEITITGNNLNIAWNESIDHGIGLSGYNYIVSTDTEYNNIIVSDFTNLTGLTLNLDSDGIYYFKIQSLDLAGNLSQYSNNIEITVDTTGPNAPSGIQFNNGSLINISNQDNSTLTAIGQEQYSGSIFEYIITDGINNLTGNGILLSGGTIQVDNLNLSVFNDGILTGAVRYFDLVGNPSNYGYGTGQKESTDPSGTIEFLSGSYTNSSSNNILISTTEPALYLINGDIIGSYSGNINDTGIINISIANQNQQNTVNMILEDNYGNFSNNITGSIIWDSILPNINIFSHSNNQIITGTSTNLTGTLMDNYSITGFNINNDIFQELNNEGILYISNGECDLAQTISNLTGTILYDINRNCIPLNQTWTGNGIDIDFNYNYQLTGGINNIEFGVFDYAGNYANDSINIIRVGTLNNIFAYSNSKNSFVVDFETDINAIGYIKYGNSNDNLNHTLTGTTTNNHSFQVTGLQPGTTYYYQVYSEIQGYNGEISNIYEITLPSVVENDYLTGNLNYTGAVYFSGAFSTGITFNQTGTLNIINNNDLVEFSLDGLTINGSGWDGIFHAPYIINLNWTGSNGTGNILTGYSLLDNFYEIGSNNSELALSGGTATIKIFVGTILNGLTLKVLRSTDGGITFNQLTTCLVSNGFCSFTSNIFSKFAFGKPSDDIPNPFTINSKSGVPLNQMAYSDQFQISGINIPSQISVINGQYSINGSAYTNLTGTVNNGDNIAVGVLSSSNYSSTTSATLNIGGVNGIFNVTTTNSSGGGSGGGGGGGGGGGTSIRTNINNNITNTKDNNIKLGDEKIKDKKNIKTKYSNLIINGNAFEYISELGKDLLKNNKIPNTINNIKLNVLTKSNKILIYSKITKNDELFENYVKLYEEMIEDISKYNSGNLSKNDLSNSLKKFQKNFKKIINEISEKSKLSKQKIGKYEIIRIKPIFKDEKYNLLIEKLDELIINEIIKKNFSEQTTKNIIEAYDDFLFSIKYKKEIKTKDTSKIAKSYIEKLLALLYK